MKTVELASIDIVVLVGYAIMIAAVGLFAARKTGGASEYFLAGRNMNWFMVGFALFASNISSTTLVGLSGDAYATGISVYNYEWMAGVVLAFYAVFLLPQVLRSQVYTMPEYLERRFDKRSRTAFAALTLFLNIVVDTAASLYAGSLLLALIFPDYEVWHFVALLAILTGVYTIAGGLSAVMVTEVIQAFLLLAGAVLITFFAYERIDGGWAAIVAQTPPEKLSLIRPLSDPGVPWLGLVTGVPLLGFYFWCTNQFMAQRMLASRDINHGRWGALLAGLLKLPVLFIMVLPGTMAILLYPDLARPDLVFPTLMFDLLPAGILGLVLAGFVAALMSSIASTLNSASTLVTMDFVRPRAPNLSSEQLVTVGRIATAAFMIFAVLWAPQIARFDSLFKYLQQVLSYSVGPVVALFIWGTFWRRANGAGAFWTLMIGFGLGAALFVLNGVLGVFNLHFLYVGPIMFVVSSVVLAVVSLSTPAPSEEAVRPFIFRPGLGREIAPARVNATFLTDYRVQIAGLLLATAAIVVAFW